MEKGRRINTMRKLFWGNPSPARQGMSGAHVSQRCRHDDLCW